MIDENDEVNCGDGDEQIHADWSKNSAWAPLPVRLVVGRYFELLASFFGSADPADRTRAETILSLNLNIEQSYDLLSGFSAPRRRVGRPKKNLQRYTEYINMVSDASILVSNNLNRKATLENTFEFISQRDGILWESVKKKFYRALRAVGGQ